LQQMRPLQRSPRQRQEIGLDIAALIQQINLLP